jgi:hypothetical protein
VTATARRRRQLPVTSAEIDNPKPQRFVHARDPQRFFDNLATICLDRGPTHPSQLCACVPTS